MAELVKVSQYRQYGYGVWTHGQGLPSAPRNDLMPRGYNGASVAKKTKLLHFFTIADIHITDKESPSQLIYLQQLFYPSLGKAPWSFVTSIYSPVMLGTTHVLDAAVQTVNALHKKDPIDFGISLGDTCNSTQYNEVRWYIDVLDGKGHHPEFRCPIWEPIPSIISSLTRRRGLIRRSPGIRPSATTDHFWMGSFPVDDRLRKSCVSDTVIAMGDVLADPKNVSKPDYYMGVLDGSTPYGDIAGAGPAGKIGSPPKVTADPDRRSLSRTEWMKEFFATSSNPVGHGF